MTEKIFYQDAYLTEFDATIKKICEKEGMLLLSFDRTAFYPEGGGQGPDQGNITTEGSTEIIPILDVQEEGDDIWHHVAAEAKPLFSEGTIIHGKIDWEHRFDHMQQHSGEHIVSGMICKEFHCDNVGFHLGEDEVTIDYNTRISMEDALKIEEKANCYL